MSTATRRLLYLAPGLVPPTADQRKSKFFHLSEFLEGDVLLPIWSTTPDQVRAVLGADAYPHYTEGRFRYTFCLCPTRLSRPRQLVRRFLFYIREGMRIHRREGGVAVIMSYGASLTGLCAVILKYLTGAKLIVEVPGVPHVGALYDTPAPNWSARLAHRVSELLFIFIVRQADHAKLLYPTQLSHYPSLRRVPTTVFHSLVPAGSIHPQDQPAERFVLFLGYPWYRKGVDVLIHAFREVADEFPDYTLRLVGWMLDTEYLKGLTMGCSQIVFQKPVGYEESLSLMSRCSIFVLPSRSEAMGRVLLEAMASRRPIIASAVDGITHYIKDGHNGLLFESENVAQLASQLRRLLRDQKLSATLARNAFEDIHRDLDEVSFVRAFSTLIDRVRPMETRDPQPTPRTPD